MIYLIKMRRPGFRKPWSAGCGSWKIRPVRAPGLQRPRFAKKIMSAACPHGAFP